MKETAEGTNFKYHACDVSDRESVKELFTWAESELGHIDILVNSAGTNIRKRRVSELDPDDWDKLININATGAFHCVQAVLPSMRERQDGVIINICSISGVRSNPLGGLAYNASKYAMRALGMTVGEEERENKIRVTNIHPGEVETPILDDRPDSCFCRASRENLTAGRRSGNSRHGSLSPCQSSRARTDRSADIGIIHLA